MNPESLNPDKKTLTKKSKEGSKMTRAVVANLNRQKAENGAASKPSSNSNGTFDVSATPSPAGSPLSSKKTSPHKSLPPQPSTKQSQSKELPDVPEFYIVRPAPSTSSAKIERNDRRVFINRGTMERINVYQGSVVLIQRHDPNRWAQNPLFDLTEIPEEDDGSHYPEDDNDQDDVEQTTVGVAWPMDKIEPNGAPRADRANIQLCE